MTKILIDRAVVEQALTYLGDEAPLCSGCAYEWEHAIRLLRAALEQPQVEQEPVRWPANASEVRAFLSGHVAAERYARDDHQPDDNDTYTLSAHDLLGAIDWWTDFDPQPPRQPLTDEQIKNLIPDGDAWKYEVGFTEATEFARAIERSHGIGGEK